MIRISEAVGALLDLVQFRLGVSLEVLDASLKPVQIALPGEFAGAIGEPGVRALCLTVVRTGESRVERSLPTPLAIYPLRVDREVVGLVLVTPASRGVSRPREAADAIEDLQTVALMARAILENDLVKTRHLSRESERIRRLQGILRFIGQLQGLRRVPDMLQAVVQAATVWFDLDCRIYQGRPDGSYALLAALPGLDPSEVRSAIEGARLRQLCASRQVTSLADLEFLSGPARRGGGLVLGVGLDDEIALVLLGGIDADVELTFNAVAQAIGGELQLAARRRVVHWQGRLAARAGAPDVAVERVLLALIEELCVAVGAAGGRVSVRKGERQRTIAALDASGKAGERLIRADPDRSHHRELSIGGGMQLHVELWGRADRFDFDALATTDAWAAVMRPWVAASAILEAEPLAEPAVADVAVFERQVQREVERAKRFDLGLALVLIEPGEQFPGGSLSDIVRTELRASDLCGPVRGGRMAAVLVHSGPEAAESVTRRIGERIGAIASDTRKAVRLGQAVFSSECRSGEALIAQALAQLEEPAIRN